MGSNSWPVYRPVSGRHSSDVLPMSLRYPCGIQQGADQFLQAVRRPDARLRTAASDEPPFIPCEPRCLADFRPAAAKSAGRRAGPGRRLSGVWAAHGRYMDCLGCPKFGPAPARCMGCPAGHRPGIGRFIGDQFAMRNAAPRFKSELKVTRCPPDAQKWPGSRKESRGAPAENA